MVGAGQKPHLAFGPTHLESLHPCLTERPCFIRKNRASETREGQMAWGITLLMIMIEMCPHPDHHLKQHFFLVKTW